MAGFFYFVPRPRSKLVRDGRLQHRELPASLQDVLDDVHEVPAQLVAAECSRGPGDQAGTVLYPVPTHGDLPQTLGYFPDQQTWRPCPAESPAYHLGWLPDSPPLPTDVERRDLLGGWLCTDGKSLRWSIPVLRSPANPRGNLPWEVAFDAADSPQCVVAGKHRKLWDDTATLWDWALTRGQANREGLLIVGEGFTDDEDQFLLDCAFRGMMINYRLDRHAIAALSEIRRGWLTQTFVSLVVNSLIDYRAKLLWDEAQKKTAIPSAAAGVSSTPGEPDAGQATDPAEAS